MLTSQSKASLTIKNYLGGVYYLTVDETEIRGNDLLLIESKHSTRDLLPSASDIKDGLLKMFLFINLKEILTDGVRYQPCPVLKLTSAKLEGSVASTDAAAVQQQFFATNNFSKKRIVFMESLFAEACVNGFGVAVSGV